ncbi:pre-mRNA-splicing factor 38A [Platysternon megacephalum]|uniref:Pre-mRNA-splicing factor 38A n=1 Tax=Platysternon megacephalum TaxID=55544 RepID=A0A4D9DL55_9SAUR|nr:pre-mRNA-splicing factor 38A [Platysternon megacephalum]
MQTKATDTGRTNSDLQEQVTNPTLLSEHGLWVKLPLGESCSLSRLNPRPASAQPHPRLAPLLPSPSSSTPRCETPLPAIRRIPPHSPTRPPPPCHKIPLPAAGSLGPSSLPHRPRDPHPPLPCSLPCLSAACLLTPQLEPPCPPQESRMPAAHLLTPVPAHRSPPHPPPDLPCMQLETLPARRSPPHSPAHPLLASSPVHLPTAHLLTSPPAARPPLLASLLPAHPPLASSLPHPPLASSLLCPPLARHVPPHSPTPAGKGSEEGRCEQLGPSERETWSGGEEEDLPGRQQQQVVGALGKGWSREGKRRGHHNPSVWRRVSGSCTKESLAFPWPIISTAHVSEPG